MKKNLEKKTKNIRTSNIVKSAAENYFLLSPASSWCLLDQKRKKQRNIEAKREDKTRQDKKRQEKKETDLKGKANVEVVGSTATLMDNRTGCLR